jgi:uncharacterized membrane protein (Fun14 family)
LNFPAAYGFVAVCLQPHRLNSSYYFDTTVELWILGVFEDIFGFITSGSIGGLPPIVVMIIPFVIGLIVGYLVHKMLKIAIIAAIVLVIVAYFGFFGLSLGALKNLSDKYGPIAVQYGTLLMGILPLGIGLVVGFIIGFIFS